MSQPPSPEALIRALSQPDLTDPRQGPHVLQDLVEQAHGVLAGRWGCRRQLHRVATVSGGPAPRLHPRTSTALPALLQGLSLDPPEELLLVCPGLAHPEGGPRHQLDLVRLSATRLDSMELAEMVTAVATTLLPAQPYRLLPQASSELAQGLRLDVADGDWRTVGRCGLLNRDMLEGCGLAGHSALLLHLDLDEVLAVREGRPREADADPAYLHRRTA